MNMKLSKLSLRKRVFIVGFAIYLTFILLSVIPYVAELEMRSRQTSMDDKYEYHLIFPQDGEVSHYIVERADTAKNGEIILTYFTNTHTLDVETKNLKKITIDCNAIYWDESMKVFKQDPFIAKANYYKQYFIDNDEFQINVKTDIQIEELKFEKFPEPVEVWVKGELWDEGTDYKFTSGGMQFTSVPSGSTKVVLFFVEKVQPTAKITTTGTLTEDKILFGELNKKITFDASDSKGTIVNYEWDFGDETEPVVGKDEESVEHTYTKLGVYEVSLTVSDENTLDDITSITLTIVKSKEDKDGDGMDDSWEIINQLDVTKDDSNEDPDKDGLTNLQEFENSTKPKRADSDNDGYNDYDEIVKYKTKPNDPTSFPAEKESEGNDQLFTYLMIVAVIIVILIILVLVMLLKKRKKKPEAEGVAGAEDEGQEGGEGPVPQQPPMTGMQMQMPMPMPGGVHGLEGMQPMPMEQQYPGAMADEGAGIPPWQIPPTEPEPPTTSETMYDEAMPSEVDEGERPYQLDGEEEPPFYKAEPEFPYTEAEEDVYQEDLAQELEGMRITPEEGIPGMEEGVPDGMEEGMPPGEVPEDEMMPEPDMDEGVLDLGGEELLEEKELAGESEVAEEPQEPKEKKLQKKPQKKPHAEKSEGEAEKEAEPEPEAEGKPEAKTEAELTVKDYVRNGAIHFKDGEYTEAILEWQKALDLEPNHPEIVASIKEAMAKLQE